MRRCGDARRPREAKASEAMSFRISSSPHLLIPASPHPRSLTLSPPRATLLEPTPAEFPPVVPGSMPHPEILPNAEQEYARLDALLEAVPLAVAVFDGQLVLAATNARYRDLTGVD